MLYSCTPTATLGDKGLKVVYPGLQFGDINVSLYEFEDFFGIIRWELYTNPFRQEVRTDNTGYDLTRIGVWQGKGLTRPRFRVVPCRLLQRGFRRGAEDYYRQIATSVERCGMCCQRHPEV